MEKRFEIQGAPASRFVQLMRKHGHNVDTTIEIAQVKSAPPNIAILLESDGLTLERDDLYIAEHLLDHQLNINGTDMTVKGRLKKGDSVIVVGDVTNQRYYIIGKVGG